MANFTKEQRQSIVKDFALRHNGVYNPKLFIEEVGQAGPDHPAYGWFEWDKNKAAYEYQLWQAREFAKDLKVSFTVEEVGRRGAISVRQATMPLVLSPVSGRKDGGGYTLSDPNDPAHLAELARQAASSLRTWMARYEAAILFAGMTDADFGDLAKRLEDKATIPVTEAAE